MSVIEIDKSNQASNIILVTGPSKSGKSRWAEYLVRNNRDLTYIATSEVKDGDSDWRMRIKLHQERRPAYWNLIESPDDLATTINTLEHKNILIDSLGGYVTKHLNKDMNEWKNLATTLINSLIKHKKTIVIVTEETGWGVVPMTKIGVLFSERLGELAQGIEARSTKSWLVIQGRAIDLKQISVIVP